ncbi:TPA: hypothetical protein I8374_002071 [Serratia marcescens]|nr:hypothetical protein [Serratia marcescens]MBE8813615.1 hypothetical protein [Serratia marcescens]MBH2708102.1 hypothetical protein [Serratia marcescens]QKO40419.1 hypothetical protein F0335_18715 [Serratia marcescens]RTF18719.1 hypothetical protein D9B84_15025 [Serratia marcescens]HAT2867637.1 hypothetical protein [Serratia marcescens]
MSLIAGNTNWVLFLAADGEPENRHVQDITFGVFCLESAGVSPKNINIYIDGQDRALINSLISIGTTNLYNIKPTNEFFADCKRNHYDNLMLFVTGHGSLSGIDAAPPITPCVLLTALKSCPGLQQSVVFLGQCFAGTFNYIGAGKKRGREAHENDPEIIFIGATNLHPSLSLSTKENLPAGEMAWLANVFLLHVFKWLSNPFDVDGDGKVTVIDAYKYAGVMSNQINHTFKVQSFSTAVAMHPQWDAARTAHLAQNTLQTLLAFQAINTVYYNNLSNNYTHQECWILNAVPAQFIEA